MLKLKIALAVFLILSFAPSYADDGGDLTLIKGSTTLGSGRMCGKMLHFPTNQDVPDMRDTETCVYTLNMRGPAGKMVTLFGSPNFKKDDGLLIVKKTDDKQVWIQDLERFPDRKWHKVEAKGEYGGYEAFYRAASGFESNVASIKWGEWWGKEDLQK